MGKHWPNFTLSRLCLTLCFSSILVLSCLNSCQQKEITAGTEVFKSNIVNDSFELYIDSLPNHQPNQPFNVLYYLDANLNSGKAFRQLLKDSVIKKKFANTLFVGVGHIGNYRSLRRRDLTVPQVSNSDTSGRNSQFAQVEPFYKFLTQELIPHIRARFITDSIHNSILGHSFGGLFSVYCLLKNDSLFQNFYALSPSLWVNNGAIYDHDHLTANSKNNYYLFMSVGGLETLNRVKPATDKFQTYISNKNFPYLRMEYQVYKGKNHYSQVNSSFNEIFKE